MKHAYDSEAIDQLHSDIDLVALTRDGDTRAFAELWARHAGAGQAFARGFSSYDAEDLTIEAFSNILASVRAGAGPTAGFRPYLLSTIRNVARNWSRIADPITTDELDHLADPATEEAAELAALDGGITATAFRSLPTRWQEVLWYSEVEAMKPREIAPLLGMSANSVSALVIRAKAGLRAAWVQAHLKKSHDPACAAVAGFFASCSLGSLAKKNVDAVDRHLAVCERDCVIVLEEASHVSSMLVLVLLPLVTGVAGAGGYLAYTQAGAHAAVSASPVWTTGSVHAIPGGSRAHLASATVKTPVTRVGLVAGIAVVAAVVIIGASVTFALILGSSGRVKTAPDAGAPVAMPSPESSPLATAIPEPASTPAAPDAPVTPPPTDAPAQKTTPRISTYTVPVSNIAAPTAVPLTTPEAAPATTLPTPVEAPDPTPTPTPTPPAVPVFTLEQDAGGLYFPLIKGADAVPGALVEAVDAAGSVLASATADLSGAWSMTDFPALPVGTSTVRLRQTVDTVVSAVSAPADVTMAPPPVVSQPAEGAVVDATNFVMQLTGASGADAQRIVNGAVRETPMPLTDGTWLGSFSIARGPVNLGIRYLDPVTGRFGLTATRLFTAQ